MTTTTVAPAPIRQHEPSRVRRSPSRGVSRALRRLPIQILIGLLLVVEIYPIVWLAIGSFRTQSEFLNEPFWALPANFNLDNYVAVFTTGNFGQFILNSITAVFPALALIIVFGVAAGFALEVMVWKGRGGVLLLFLAGIMVPAQMILLPLFTVYYRTNLMGSLWPLIITYTAIGLPLTVFMMATYFRAIPREMFEAATLDGASVLRSFWSVGFPMVRNAIFTVGLVQFFFIWNDLLIAITFTNSSKLQTIQAGLLNFTGEYGAVQYGPTFAAICVSVFGTLVIYLVLNQRIMRGLSAGSVKG
ncbi:carbohydrate ABC transporter permease [Cryobacterium glucosi]|uniref:Carbohydrate ABC transporter permease n=1 Tax=Cryobacterium glucosi TaxID=1259175 RepID=A0ABY2INC6_9MICO|nr:carbohydrate ABC transporter permease [Cryobacterium glucosi]TFC21129.1 carbohydrate ABC transporter permease [Cryobacterium glucosi]